MIELPTEEIGFMVRTTQPSPASWLATSWRAINSFEWLGTGFYLWQDSPWRAQGWAVDRFGDEAAVVAARVSLDGCLEWTPPARVNRDAVEFLRTLGGAFEAVEVTVSGNIGLRGDGYHPDSCSPPTWPRPTTGHRSTPLLPLVPTE